jgi:WXG100 family type VII secretion target
MSEIKVTFGALEAARSDVAGTESRISGQLADLRRIVTPLVAGWEGQAAAEYQVKQRRWDASAADLAAVRSNRPTRPAGADTAWSAEEAVTPSQGPF